MNLACAYESVDEQPRRVFLVLVVPHNLAKEVTLADIPADTLIMHRGTLRTMYGPTLAFLVHLDDAYCTVPRSRSATDSGYSL